MYISFIFISRSFGRGGEGRGGEGLEGWEIPFALIYTILMPKILKKAYSNGTTDGQRFVRAEQTRIILSINGQFAVLLEQVR